MLVQEQTKALDEFKTNVEAMASQELLRLEAERTLLTNMIVPLTEQIKQVNAILRSVSNGNSGPKKKKRQASDFSMSEEREREMIGWLTGNKDEITSRKVKTRFPEWSDSYCNMSLKMLRETGVIRLAATSGPMNVYRTLL